MVFLLCPFTAIETGGMPGVPITEILPILIDYILRMECSFLYIHTIDGRAE